MTPTHVPKGKDESAPDHQKYDPDLVQNTPTWFEPVPTPDSQ